MGAEECLEGIKKLAPCTFTFKPDYAELCADKTEHMGLIAQELREVFLNGPDGAKGTLVQPTPTNNPKSNVFIVELTGPAFERIAGVHGQALKGELWRKGEIGRFGAVTSKKLGTINLAVRGATVKWSKNQSKLNVTARLMSSSAGSSSGGYCCDSDDDMPYGWLY